MMKTNFSFTYIMVFLLLAFPLSACSVELIPTKEPAPATPTPDPCTGWTCTLEGVVYPDAGSRSIELAGMTVDFKQVSNCSPTKGEYQAITDEAGRFSFEVFLHDTDSFVFEVNLEGYQPARLKLGGFDCLYCACDPIEILLYPAE